MTVNITTLPINTVLSRPPPQIHVARTPNQTQAPPPSQVALASDNQLEALLEDAEPQTQRLMEEFKHQLLERPHSPMDTSDLTFSDTPPSTLHLQDTGLDNMEWLDLTIPGPAGISSPTVFSSDFLDSTDLQLHWDWAHKVIKIGDVLKRSVDPEGPLNRCALRSQTVVEHSSSDFLASVDLEWYSERSKQMWPLIA